MPWRPTIPATLPATYPIVFRCLLIDGSGAGDDAYYLRTALSPGGSAKPGWSPRVEPPSFLRNHDQLDKFAAIFLLDVPRLDDSEVTALEDYVRAGGGVAIFLGSGSSTVLLQRTALSRWDGIDARRDSMCLLNCSVLVMKRRPMSRSRTIQFFVFSQASETVFSPLRRVNFYYAISRPWRKP